MKNNTKNFFSDIYQWDLHRLFNSKEKRQKLRLKFNDLIVPVLRNNFKNPLIEDNVNNQINLIMQNLRNYFNVEKFEFDDAIKQIVKEIVLDSYRLKNKQHHLQHQLYLIRKIKFQINYHALKKSMIKQWIIIENVYFLVGSIIILLIQFLILKLIF